MDHSRFLSASPGAGYFAEDLPAQGDSRGNLGTLTEEPMRPGVTEDPANRPIDPSVDQQATYASGGRLSTCFDSSHVDGPARRLPQPDPTLLMGLTIPSPSYRRRSSAPGPSHSSLVPLEDGRPMVLPANVTDWLPEGMSNACVPSNGYQRATPGSNPHPLEQDMMEASAFGGMAYEGTIARGGSSAEYEHPVHTYPGVQEHFGGERPGQYRFPDINIETNIDMGIMQRPSMRSDDPWSTYNTAPGSSAGDNSQAAYPTNPTPGQQSYYDGSSASEWRSDKYTTSRSSMDDREPLVDSVGTLTGPVELVVPLPVDIGYGHQHPQGPVQGQLLHAQSTSPPVPGQDVPSLSRSIASSERTTSPGPDPIFCPICGNRYSGEYRRGNLSRHVRQKHGEVMQSYPCEDPDCTKTFCRQDARLKHYRRRHPHLATGPPVPRPH